MKYSLEGLNLFHSANLILSSDVVQDMLASFLDLHMFISNDIVSTKIYDKRDDFDFEIVNFPFKMVIFLALHSMEFIFLNSFDLQENLVMLLTSTQHKLLTQKLIKQGYWYHKLCKTFF